MIGCIKIKDAPSFEARCLDCYSMGKLPIVLSLKSGANSTSYEQRKIKRPCVRFVARPWQSTSQFRSAKLKPRDLYDRAPCGSAVLSERTIAS
jgi:hypothetical protein